LYDLWCECSEDWTVVQVQYTRWELETNTNLSIDNYMTKAQIAKHYNDESVATAIVAEKVKRGGKWVMKHPETPDLESATLYLCWFRSSVETQVQKGKRTQMTGEVDVAVGAAERSAFQTAPLTLEPLTVGGASSAEGSAPTPAPVPVPKPEPKPPKVRDPWDVAKGELTKAANLVRGSLRKLQGLLVEVENLPVERNKNMYIEKLKSLNDAAHALEHKAEATLALKKKATAEHMQTLCTELEPKVNDVVVDVRELEKLIIPAPPKAAKKAKAKASPAS
jgi:hypothetical protein